MKIKVTLPHPLVPDEQVELVREFVSVPRLGEFFFADDPNVVGRVANVFHVSTPSGGKPDVFLTATWVTKQRYHQIVAELMDELS